MRLINADALLEALRSNDVGLGFDSNWIYAQITIAPTVQREGWVSVPIEPTEEMIIALKSALKEWKNDEECYKAMISAAPTLKEKG